MAVNKVVYGNDTLVDLTNDTVTAENLLEGYTAHDKTGTLITGTASGGGALPTNFYPFSSKASLSGAGGSNKQHFTLTKEEIVNIKKMYLQGTVWTYASGKSVSFTLMYFLICRNPSSGDHYFYYQGGLVKASILSGALYSSNAGNTVGSASGTTSCYVLLDTEIDIETAVNHILNLGYDFDVQYCALTTGCCLPFALLFNSFKQQESTTSGYTGWSVSKGSSRVNSYDTGALLSSNPPQIRIEYK